MLAQKLVAPGKGILAADESTPTIERRFASVGLASTEEQRRAYRELLFTTPDIDTHLSGIILSDETVHQRASEGTPMPELVRSRGIIPGVKVDRGAVELAGFPGEKVTEGLDGLRSRLVDYVSLGALFAKWRAVVAIGRGRPTMACINANCHALARYAALCQEAGLVPIVEPEVLMDGDHSMAACAAATGATLWRLFSQLAIYRVDLAATILKVNMVLPGERHAQQPSLDEVADATLGVLRTSVPAAVPGIVFLSGGQSPLEATSRLDAISRQRPQPWQLSFSFGRALQAPALALWHGKTENRSIAQAAFRERVRLAGAARDGRYEPAMEPAATAVGSQAGIEERGHLETRTRRSRPAA